MVKKSDYQKEEVNACLSVLIELLTILGEFKENIVLVGGWIPYFLLGNKGKEHVGSLDIDIALNFENITDNTYSTILKLLKTHGYAQGREPFIFYRKYKNTSGKEMDIEIDLLAAEYGGTSSSHRTQRVQDIRARKARGCDLAFLYKISTKISAKMPDGAKNQIEINISSIIPFLSMKGMAIESRYKEKDAYDIYFVIKNYPGGIEKLAEEFKPIINNKLVKEGLGKIRKKFKSFESPGPVWVAEFLEIDDSEERERIIRDAYERVNAFLDKFDIKEYKR